MSDGEAPALSIAALGTSLTARGGWLETLPERLAPVLPRPVTTHNFGRVGATSRDGLALLDTVLEIRPHVVLLEFAINDAAIHRSVSLAESIANVASMVRRLRGALPDLRLYLMTMNPVRGWRSLLRPRLDAYYEQYAPLAAREQVAYIDNRASWKALSPSALAAALPDGRHPLARVAQAIVAANVAAAIERDFAGTARPPHAHAAGDGARVASTESKSSR
jgi:lysophospholipase L1-like esterase